SSSQPTARTFPSRDQARQLISLSATSRVATRFQDAVSNSCARPCGAAAANRHPSGDQATEWFRKSRGAESLSVSNTVSPVATFPTRTPYISPSARCLPSGDQVRKVERWLLPLHSKQVARWDPVVISHNQTRASVTAKVLPSHPVPITAAKVLP